METILTPDVDPWNQGFNRQQRAQMNSFSSWFYVVLEIFPKIFLFLEDQASLDLEDI